MAHKGVSRGPTDVIKKKCKLENFKLVRYQYFETSITVQWLDT